MSAPETIVTFTHQGNTIEIDHLGIHDEDNRGEFAVYCADKQIGEFMLPWAVLKAEAKRGRPLPSDEEIIDLARKYLDGDPRVLTQHRVLDAFEAAGGGTV